MYYVNKIFIKIQLPSAPIYFLFIPLDVSKIKTKHIEVVLQTTQEVFPVLVYSNLVLTLVALLVTDVLQYKTLIVTGAIAALASKGIMFWSTTVTHLQVNLRLTPYFCTYKESYM